MLFRSRTTKPERPAVATQPAWSCCGGRRTATKFGPGAGATAIQSARLAAAAASPAVDQRLHQPLVDAEHVPRLPAGVAEQHVLLVVVALVLLAPVAYAGLYQAALIVA